MILPSSRSARTVALQPHPAEQRATRRSPSAPGHALFNPIADSAQRPRALALTITCQVIEKGRH